VILIILGKAATMARRAILQPSNPEPTDCTVIARNRAQAMDVDPGRAEGFEIG
jgi:hypothetical protein